MDEIILIPALENEASSWICLLLFFLFFITCIRGRGNVKFIGTFFRDLIVVRERQNLFDVTMKETSFIFFVLLLSGCSAGVLLSNAVTLYGHSFPVHYDIDLPLRFSGPLLSALVCMAVVCAYIGVMWIGYNIVGHVFSDDLHTWLWVRGFTSGTGLSAAIFFPLALCSCAYPDSLPLILTIASFVLILVKLLFVIRGFRIFFSESSLWVVFLYYLCSLEIVPLVITFGLACEMLG